MAKPRTSPEYLWRGLIDPQSDTGNFLVQSESDASVSYIVDLMAYDGAGHCTCDDYSTRVGCFRAKEIEPIHKNCKHIRRCYEFVGEEFIRKLSEMERKGEIKVDPTRFKKVPPCEERKKR